MGEEKKDGKTALMVGIVTAFITSFFGSALNLAIPDISVHFSMGASSVGWVISVYMLIVAGFSTPFGKVADSTGRRRVLIIGTAIFGAASFMAPLSVNAAMLLIIRGVQAIGASMIFATNMPMAISAYPPSQRGMVIGKVTGGTYVGLTLGPIMGGFFNGFFGWQSIFIFGGVVAVVALIAVITRIEKDDMPEERMKVDVPGNIIYVVMITAIIYGLTAMNTFRFAWVILAAGVILIVVFAKVELKAEEPVIDVRIFATSRAYLFSNLVALFNYSATYGLGYLTSIYLQVALGYSSKMAGLVLIAQPFFMALLTPRMGKLSDRVSPYRLASAGMALCALSLLFYTFMKTDTPVWAIIAALAVAGIGVSLFSSPNTNVVMSCVHPSRFGVANSILATMRNTGHATGMAIITMVVSAVVGNASLYDVPADELVRTMHIAFAVFTALCVAGIFMSLARRKA